VTISCTNSCGTGSKTCENERWGACVVSDTARSCNNACGVGVEHCSNDRWGDCEVPSTERACSDACGAGIETCQKGVWGGCTVPAVVQSCASVCGAGKKTCQYGLWTACDAPMPGPPKLVTTLRDFHRTHPDFERNITGDASDLGMVEPLLGNDDTPTYAHTGGTLTVTGPETFAQWYHDVPGVNVTISYDIQLQAATDKPGFFVYSSIDFFPLDGDPRGFGNEGFNHDFDFTLATKFTFHYMGGEVFRFIGDDDLWVFVNRHLAIDLGGLHQSKTGEVYLDQHAAEFGITPGNTYELHLFFAERHVINSDFSVETTIADPGTCE